MKKILTIIGPTAVGKTNISIKIAKLIKGQIFGGSMEIIIGTKFVMEEW